MQPIYRQPAPIFRIADLNEPIWLSLSPSPSSTRGAEEAPN
jgi:hypothetical protein